MRPGRRRFDIFSDLRAFFKDARNTNSVYSPGPDANFEAHALLLVGYNNNGRYWIARWVDRASRCSGDMMAARGWARGGTGCRFAGLLAGWVTQALHTHGALHIYPQRAPPLCSARCTRARRSNSWGPGFANGGTF